MKKPEKDQILQAIKKIRDGLQDIASAQEQMSVDDILTYFPDSYEKVLTTFEDELDKVQMKIGDRTPGV